MTGASELHADETVFGRVRGAAGHADWVGLARGDGVELFGQDTVQMGSGRGSSGWLRDRAMGGFGDRYRGFDRWQQRHRTPGFTRRRVRRGSRGRACGLRRLRRSRRCQARDNDGFGSCQERAELRCHRWWRGCRADWKRCRREGRRALYGRGQPAADDEVRRLHARKRRAELPRPKRARRDLGLTQPGIAASPAGLAGMPEGDAGRHAWPGTAGAGSGAGGRVFGLYAPKRRPRLPRPIGRRIGDPSRQHRSKLAPVPEGASHLPKESARRWQRLTRDANPDANVPWCAV
jgi:hypothetical protein